MTPGPRCTTTTPSPRDSTATAASTGNPCSVTCCQPGSGTPGPHAIHVASNNTAKPSPERSRVAKLSLTEQPAEPSTNGRTSAAVARGSSVTASG
ncbi:hypothetical protein [Amycolatopsis sp. NPDC051128]|uniref:hypothetical protein n=1 Tax=Amycolatopsis sp. NPDC051128 TaxID=3155412 RepID=UPI00343AEF1A